MSQPMPDPTNEYTDAADKLEANAKNAYQIFPDLTHRHDGRVDLSPLLLEAATLLRKVGPLVEVAKCCCCEELLDLKNDTGICCGKCFDMNSDGG